MRRAITASLIIAAAAALAACQSAGRSGSPAAAVSAVEGGPITRYLCSDGAALSAQIDPGRSSAKVTRGGGFSVVLPTRRPESGLWFADDSYELRGQGPEVTFGPVGQDAVVCRVVG